jgi:hypothetical protein
MSFDIVIPLGPNEISNINEQIIYTKKNVIGYRNIYIISCNLNIKIDSCIIIDENIFPFKNFIFNHFIKHNGKKNRNGWYFQQLIKLYAGHYISELLDDYLVIDADVLFLKPLIFIENNKPIFATGTENHKPYFTHMNLLNNNFTKTHNKSGICHHMLFNKKYINEIFTIVEMQHQKPFWQAFILSVFEHLNHSITTAESGASEYELYFNYMVKNYNNNIIIRDLTWENISKYRYINRKFNLNNDYISICSYLS